MPKIHHVREADTSANTRVRRRKNCPSRTRRQSQTVGARVLATGVALLGRSAALTVHRVRLHSRLTLVRPPSTAGKLPFPDVAAISNGRGHALVCPSCRFRPPSGSIIAKYAKKCFCLLKINEILNKILQYCLCIVRAREGAAPTTMFPLKLYIIISG